MHKATETIAGAAQIHLLGQTKFSRPDGFNNRNDFFPSQLLILVQDQDASMFGFFSGLSMWLAEGHSFATSLHGAASVPTCPWCLCVQISSYKTLVKLG